MCILLRYHMLSRSFNFFKSLHAKKWKRDDKNLDGLPIEYIIIKRVSEDVWVGSSSKTSIDDLFILVLTHKVFPKNLMNILLSYLHKLHLKVGIDPPWKTIVICLLRGFTPGERPGLQTSFQCLHCSCCTGWMNSLTFFRLWRRQADKSWIIELVNVWNLAPMTTLPSAVCWFILDFPYYAVL